VTQTNQIANIKEEIIYYDIDTGPGQSGSPVHVNDQEDRVVAIHSAYDPRNKLKIGTLITKNITDIL